MEPEAESRKGASEWQHYIPPRKNWAFSQRCGGIKGLADKKHKDTTSKVIAEEIKIPIHQKKMSKKREPQELSDSRG